MLGPAFLSFVVVVLVERLSKICIFPHAGKESPPLHSFYLSPLQAPVPFLHPIETVLVKDKMSSMLASLIGSLSTGFIQYS